MWFEKVSFSYSISTRHEIIINKVRKEYKLSQSILHMLNINEICLFLFLFFVSDDKTDINVILWNTKCIMTIFGLNSFGSGAVVAVIVG
jgi:hypothetical protein